MELALVGVKGFLEAFTYYCGKRQMAYLIYGGSWCKYCADAERLLQHYDLPYKYKSLDDSVEEEAEANQKFFKDQNFKSVPQIFEVPYEGCMRHIGGYTELKKELLRGSHGETET